MSLGLITAFIADYLSTFGALGANAIAASGEMALQRLFRKRAETGRDIFIEEMKLGKRTTFDLAEEDAAAVTFRYMRASVEGTARLNLRLMAAVASGQAEGPGLYADEFLRWADSLASLSREEIIVLGVVQQHAAEVDYKVPLDGNFWTNCLDTLSSKHDMDRSESDANAAACLRTGLLHLYGELIGGHVYLPSKRLRNLAGLADIEGVLQRDGAAQYS